MAISKYSLESSKAIEESNHRSDALKNDKIILKRLSESMRINDQLTFIFDMNEKGCIVEIELNDTKQSKELKFVLHGIDKIAFCASLWTERVSLRILSWILVDKL